MTHHHDTHEFKKKKLPVAPDGDLSDEKKENKIDRRKDSSNMQKADKDRIDRELQEIYENSDGSLPDMRTFEKRQRSKLITAFGVLLLAMIFLGSVAWAGFFFFQPEVRFQEEKIVLSISGETAVMIGAPVTYRIRYRNDQRVPLARARVEVRYPDGFVFVSSSVPSAGDSGDSWEIGALPEGGSGYIDVVGRLYGDVGKEQSFRTFFNYLPANISSEFQKVATVSVTLDESPVAIAIEGPSEAVAGKENTLKIIVKRKAYAADLPDLWLVLNPPAEYAKKTSQPNSDEFAPFRWTLPAGKEDFIVTLIGSFGGEGQAGLSASVLGGKENDNERRYVFAETAYTAALVERRVQARIGVNGSATGTISVAPGEVLRVIVSVENTGDRPIANIRARAMFDAPAKNNKSIFDWAELEDERDGIVVGEQLDSVTRRGSVQWDKRQIPALAALAPGESADIEFSLPLKGADNQVLSAMAGIPLSILAQTDIEYDGPSGRETLTGNQITLHISSDTALAVEHAAEGQKHVVTWILSNSYHTLRDIRVEADAYGEAVWDAESLTVPAGEAMFDEARKRVIWTVMEMPESVDILALRFGLILTADNPTQKNLMSKVRLRATDAVTGKEIVIAGEEVVLP